MAITMPSLSMGQALRQTFNLNSRFRDLELRAARLERYLMTQHAITQIIAQSSELSRAIPLILKAICETADWDFGEVWFIDDNDNQLYCDATWCMPSLRFPGFEKSGKDITFAHGKGLPGRVWASRKSAWVTNVVVDRNFMRATLAEQDGLRGGIAVPIQTDGDVLGALTFFSRKPRPIDRELLQVLDTVGSQIGLFIERRRAEQVEREQSRMLAALEERQRLSRDLHDSVTQTLFSASVIAEMLPILWTRDPEQVKPGLDQLHELTTHALTEMRSLLVELRPPALVNGDLVGLLKSLADTLTSRTNIQVSLNVQLSVIPPTDIQIALYRITQEALNNITKHAAATHVAVRLCGDMNQISLYIEDNGRGFDMTDTPMGHFGLDIMRERADVVGATLQIDSAPGAGTRLSIHTRMAANLGQ